MRKEVGELGSKAVDERVRPLYNITEDMPEFLTEYENSLDPVESTIPQLDAMLNGGFRPGVHFIGGNTGAGKSSFCIWLAERIASCVDSDTGEPTGVTYISLELSKAEVRARMDSRISYFKDGMEPFRWADFEKMGRRMKAGRMDGTYDPMTDPVYMADIELMANCPNMRIVDNIKDPNANRLMDVCMEIASLGMAGGRICFVDYLQCIDCGQGFDEQEAMKETVRELNLAGIRAGVAVVCIAAVNRAKGNEMSNSDKAKNPGADIFRGSSWIEYTGLSAFALIRRKDTERVGGFTEIELYPVKNRRGTCDKPVLLAYNGAYGEWVYKED